MRRPTRNGTPNPATGVPLIDRQYEVMCSNEDTGRSLPLTARRSISVVVDVSKRKYSMLYGEGQIGQATHGDELDHRTQDGVGSRFGKREPQHGRGFAIMCLFATFPAGSLVDARM